MPLVFENVTHQIEYDRARQLVISRRTRVGIGRADREELLGQVLDALYPLRNQRLLLDVRLAPGNNDPIVEASINRFRHRLSLLFPISATLAATAIGRLQITRLMRERGEPGQARHAIFLDETEALAYLMAHEV
jgi:hypothetical protein